MSLALVPNDQALWREIEDEARVELRRFATTVIVHGVILGALMAAGRVGRKDIEAEIAAFGERPADIDWGQDFADLPELDVDWARMRPTMLRAIETFTDKTLAQLTDARQRATRDAVTRSYIEGSGSKGAIRHLRDSGLFDPVAARRVAVTATTSLLGEGARLQYQQLGYERWEWNTAADDRVCPICVGLDGAALKSSTSFQAAHPGCRCWPSPSGTPVPMPMPAAPGPGGWPSVETEADLYALTDRIARRIWEDEFERKPKWVEQNVAYNDPRRDAWHDYTGSGYQAINAYQRGGAKLLKTVSSRTAAAIKQSIEDLDGLMAFSLDEDAYLWRGTTTEAFIKPKTGAMATSGDRLKLKGFTSATTDVDIARSFMVDQMIMIKVPAGTKFIPGVVHEQEFILPRGAEYKIVGQFEHPTLVPRRGPTGPNGRAMVLQMELTDVPGTLPAAFPDASGKYATVPRATMNKGKEKAEPEPDRETDRKRARVRFTTLPDEVEWID